MGSIEAKVGRKSAVKKSLLKNSTLLTKWDKVGRTKTFGDSWQTNFEKSICRKRSDVDQQPERKLAIYLTLLKHCSKKIKTDQKFHKKVAFKNGSQSNKTENREHIGTHSLRGPEMDQIQAGRLKTGSQLGWCRSVI